MKFGDFELQDEPLSQQIAHKIQQMVTRHELRPGDRLPSERQLAEQLQVSRNVIREAIALLKDRGVVSVHTGSGIYISDVSHESVTRSVGVFVQRKQVSVAQLFEIRWILEVENARLAAVKATPEDIHALEQFLAEMEQNIDQLERFTAADMAFHRRLAQASQNPLLPVLFDTMIDLLHKQAMLATAVPGGADSALTHHRNILHAVRAKSSILARGAMSKHLASGWEFLLRAVENPEKELGEMSYLRPDF